MIWLALWVYVLIGIGVAVKVHEVHCQVVAGPVAECSRVSAAAIIVWPILIGHSMDVGVK
jgi:hypothetical protein